MCMNIPRLDRGALLLTLLVCHSSCSHVLAAYASFLWEQDDDEDCGDQGTAGGAAAQERAAGTGQAMELASAAV